MNTFEQMTRAKMVGMSNEQIKKLANKLRKSLPTRRAEIDRIESEMKNNP